MTEREKEVLRLIAFGYTNIEVAARLSLSVKPSRLTRRGMEKKGMKSPDDIVRYAMLRGWLQDT